MLSQARQLGFFQLPVNGLLLQSCREFAPLEKREAFRQLVAGVEGRPAAD
jgi:hypothetical protein